jgi:hypothetical protein
MSTLQYSNDVTGPWVDLVSIDCSNGFTRVLFRRQPSMAQSIFLRTSGSWGNSEPKLIRLTMKLALVAHGIPANPSNDQNFSIQLSGEHITHYRFSFGPSERQNCGAADLYLPPRTIDLPISATELNYLGLGDQSFRLCVVTQSDKGDWGIYELADSWDWNKDTTALLPILTFINGRTVEGLASEVHTNQDRPVFQFEQSQDDGATIKLFNSLNCAAESNLGSAILTQQKSSLYLGAGKVQEGLNSIYIQLTDLLGNQSPCAKLITYSLDSIAPKVLTVSGWVNKTYGAGESIAFEINLSEATFWNQDLGLPKLKLNIGGAIKEALYIASKSTSQKLHFEYTVAPGDNDTDGITLTSPLAIPENITMLDAAQNSLIPDFTSPTTNEIIFDTQAPTLLSVNASSPTLWSGTAQTISIIITFSEICDFSQATELSLPLNVGTAIANANCVLPGALATTISCTYTVAANQLDLDGIATINNKLMLIGTISDRVNILTDLTIPNSEFPTIKVDSTAPVVGGLAINDGIVSTSLEATPPLTWTGASDEGSGLKDYTLELLDETGTVIFTKAYSDPQTNLTIIGLSLTDFTSATKQFHTYTSKIIVSDQAGNQSLVYGDGWRIIQFSEKASLSPPTPDQKFGSRVALSSDGKRLLVTSKTSQNVTLYKFDTFNQQWVLLQDLADPIGTNSNFGYSLAILNIAPDSYLYAIGAPGDGSLVAGAVVLYRESSSAISFAQTVQMQGVTLQNNDEFGSSLDFVNGQLIVGAPGFNGTLLTDSGLISSFTCAGSDGYCEATGGGGGFEIDRGVASNQRLGEMLTASSQGTTSQILFASKNGNGIVKYTYSVSDLAWLQVSCNGALTCELWPTGNKISYLDSFNQTVVASNGSSNAKISIDGSTFSTLAGTSGIVGPVAVIGDPLHSGSLNTGIFVLAAELAGATVKVFKVTTTSAYFLKQTFTGLGDLTEGFLAGSGTHLVLGNPSLNKVLILR